MKPAGNGTARYSFGWLSSSSTFNEETFENEYFPTVFTDEFVFTINDAGVITGATVTYFDADNGISEQGEWIQPVTEIEELAFTPVEVPEPLALTSQLQTIVRCQAKTFLITTTTM